MITENPMQRKGPLLGSQVQTILEVAQLTRQINRLHQELARTYQPIKIKSINSVDLEAERKNTIQCLVRLLLKRKAMRAAFAQDVKRRWTERGDFSTVLYTGVILNGN